jgi:transcriptional regulator with XRE-family HTH domain
MAGRDIKALGKLLRNRRKAKGFTLRAVAEKTNVRDTTIMRIEQGQIAKPSPELLTQLADMLGLSVAEVYGLAGYTIAADLPSMPVYLRTKYRDLPLPARRELNDYFEKLKDKYGFDGSLPKDGEDEK